MFFWELYFKAAEEIGSDRLGQLNDLRGAKVEEAVGCEERSDEKIINISTELFPNGLQPLALRQILFEDVFHTCYESHGRSARGKLTIGRC